MPRNYEVDVCWGHPDHLRDLVREIGKSGGRVVSVMWNPDCTIKDGGKQVNLESSYVVVTEYDPGA